jgi:hypothetical protein
METLVLLTLRKQTFSIQVYYKLYTESERLVLTTTELVMCTTFLKAISQSHAFSYTLN